METFVNLDKGVHQQVFFMKESNKFKNSSNGTNHLHLFSRDVNLLNKSA